MTEQVTKVTAAIEAARTEAMRLRGQFAETREQDATLTAVVKMLEAALAGMNAVPVTEAN